MRNLSKPFATLAIVAAITGCAVGPEYVRPETSTGSAFQQSQDALFASATPEVEFWKTFADPQLTQLIEQSLAANTDLRVALARVDRARALTRQQRLDLLPAVTAEAGHTEARASAAQAPGVPREQRDSGTERVAADLSWELDLWGRVRHAVSAGEAETDALTADLRGVQVAVAAEVARTYFDLRGAQEQLRVAEQNAGNQRESLRLTQIRLDAGRGTEFDTERGRAQLEATVSRIPALQGRIAADAHRLAVLQGREPSALLQQLQKPGDLPALPNQVAVGTPADLLRRRPDIQAAERRLAAATARVGVVTADLFPRLTFGGSVGTSATSLGDLFGRDSETYSFGPNFSWAFLDLNRVRARIDASDAETQGQLAAYQGTVLRALEETETALSTHAQARREQEHLVNSVQAAAKAASLARIRFEGGLVDFLEVLDAERTKLDAEQRLTDSRMRTEVALVDVFKAVAGGWPVSSTVAGVSSEQTQVQAR